MIALLMVTLLATAAYGTLLERYVVDDRWVDYAAWRASDEDHRALENYIDELTATDLFSLGRDAQIAACGSCAEDEFGRQCGKAPVLGICHRVLFRVAGLPIECREFAPCGRQRRVQTHSLLIGGACTIRLGERPENVSFFLVGACVLGRNRL